MSNIKGISINVLGSTYIIPQDKIPSLKQWLISNSLVLSPSLSNVTKENQNLNDGDGELRAKDLLLG